MQINKNICVCKYCNKTFIKGKRLQILCSADCRKAEYAGLQRESRHVSRKRRTLNISEEEKSNRKGSLLRALFGHDEFFDIGSTFALKATGFKLANE